MADDEQRIPVRNMSGPPDNTPQGVSNNEPGGAPVVVDNQFAAGATVAPSASSSPTQPDSPQQVVSVPPPPEDVPAAPPTLAGSFDVKSSGDAPPNSSAETAAPEASSVPPVEHPALPAHASGGRPIGAIIAAIVIAVLLAGLSIFAYLTTKDKIEPVANNSAANSRASVTPQDVDTTAQGIDEAINSMDNEDLNTELSDTSLGL